jgi:hypothetical protein
MFADETQRIVEGAEAIKAELENDPTPYRRDYICKAIDGILGIAHIIGMDPPEPTLAIMFSTGFTVGEAIQRMSRSHGRRSHGQPITAPIDEQEAARLALEIASDSHNHPEHLAVFGDVLEYAIELAAQPGPLSRILYTVLYCGMFVERERREKTE